MIYVNPHFERSTGYTSQEALGNTPRLLKSGLQPPEFYTQLWETISHGETWHGIMADSRKDGSLHYEDFNIFPIRDSEEHITHYAGISQDITERIAAEREREALILDLDAFTHTVAHDLKGPLTLVCGYSDLLLEGFHGYSEPEVLEMLAALNSGAAKMGRIIDELLLFASTRQSADVEKSPLDMLSIVKEAISRNQLLIEERHAEIIFLNPEDWPDASSHSPWIEEVWANYISNAIKYGGEVPHIELGAEVQDKDKARFWVRDNGAGISPEKQAQLFKPFTRLSDLRIQGHGLGLSIVQRIVNKLGGEVGVKSVENQGSTFYFTLPMLPIIEATEKS
jgi:PAS domain S-box-containing protein